MANGQDFAKVIFLVVVVIAGIIANKDPRFPDATHELQTDANRIFLLGASSSLGSEEVSRHFAEQCPCANIRSTYVTSEVNHSSPMNSLCCSQYRSISNLTKFLFHSNSDNAHAPRRWLWLFTKAFIVNVKDNLVEITMWPAAVKMDISSRALSSSINPRKVSTPSPSTICTTPWTAQMHPHYL